MHPSPAKLRAQALHVVCTEWTLQLQMREYGAQIRSGMLDNAQVTLIRQLPSFAHAFRQAEYSGTKLYKPISKCVHVLRLHLPVGPRQVMLRPYEFHSSDSTEAYTMLAANCELAMSVTTAQINVYLFRQVAVWDLRQHMNWQLHEWQDHSTASVEKQVPLVLNLQTATL